MDKVIELRKQGLTQDEIATVVGASDVTIRKHLQIYSKLREKQDHPFERYVDSFAEKRKIQYRVYIEQALSQEYLVSSRREIRKSNHFKYDWLMKHDREWMEEHLPPRVPNKKKISNHDELDAEMVALLKLAIEKVYATNSVRQICKNTILKKVPKECSSRLSRITNECFYPKSFQLLMNAIETSEHYLKRIFPVMVQRFEQSRYHLLSFQILCNFKKGYRKCEGELREWVEENIRLYINNPSLITLKEN
jgi:predicted transcriptional regulator